MYLLFIYDIQLFLRVTSRCRSVLSEYNMSCDDVSNFDFLN